MNITFERTCDYPLLTKLLRNESLYPYMADDYSLPIDKIFAVEDPNIWYILSYCEDELLGFFILIPKTIVCWEYHTVMLLNRKALAATQAFYSWVWNNTPCFRIITDVPSCNPIASRFGIRAGLKSFGLNPKSYQKNGKLVDLIMLGISSTQEKVCQH